MRGVLIVLLCAVAIYLALQFISGSKDEKSYAEKTIEGLQTAKTTLNTTHVRPIKEALLTYKAHQGDFPEGLSDLVPGYLPSARHIQDSWGNPFVLVREGSDQAVIVSVGIDGRLGTEDDLRFPL